MALASWELTKQLFWTQGLPHTLEIIQHLLVRAANHNCHIVSSGTQGNFWGRRPSGPLRIGGQPQLRAPSGGKGLKSWDINMGCSQIGSSDV